LRLSFFADHRTRLGLTLAVFLSGVPALLIPHGLIGGCSSPSMICRKISFPSITVICILLLIAAALNFLYLAGRDKNKKPS
jgi:hypothetical protein